MFGSMRGLYSLDARSSLQSRYEKGLQTLPIVPCRRGAKEAPAEDLCCRKEYVTTGQEGQGFRHYNSINNTKKDSVKSHTAPAPVLLRSEREMVVGSKLKGF